MNYAELSTEELLKQHKKNMLLLQKQIEIVDQIGKIVNARTGDFLTHQAKAERIEKLILHFISGNLRRFQYLFPNTWLIAPELMLIHSDCKAHDITLFRQIIIYYVYERSGLTREQVAAYFEMDTLWISNIKRIITDLKTVDNKFWLVMRDIEKQLI